MQRYVNLQKKATFSLIHSLTFFGVVSLQPNSFLTDSDLIAHVANSSFIIHAALCKSSEKGDFLLDTFVDLLWSGELATKFVSYRFKPPIRGSGENERTGSDPCQPLDLVYDSSLDKIYVAVDASQHPQGPSIAVLNPETRRIQKWHAVEGEPIRLAISGDGRYLYVALGNSVQRIDTMDLAAAIFKKPVC